MYIYIYIYMYIYVYIYIYAIKLSCSGYMCFGIARHLIRPYNKIT